MHVSPEDPPQLGDRFQPSNSLMDVRKCESEPLMPKMHKYAFFAKSCLVICNLTILDDAEVFISYLNHLIDMTHPLDFSGKK